MNPSTPRSLLAGIASLALVALSGSAFAQAASQPSRADVKAETRAANKAGQLPSGEAGDKQKPMASTKTRAERKAETREANKGGGLGSPGEKLYKGYNAPRDSTRGTSKTRAERKAETREAAKQGKLPPAGEAEPAKK